MGYLALLHILLLLLLLLTINYLGLETSLHSVITNATESQSVLLKWVEMMET